MDKQEGISHKENNSESEKEEGNETVHAVHKKARKVAEKLFQAQDSID